MAKNPFGDDELSSKPENPFGDDELGTSGAGDPVATIEHSAARIRRLKSLVGSEGLTLSATRELLDHISAALDAVARSIRERE